MDSFEHLRSRMTRRHFFGRSATAVGLAALGSLLKPSLLSGAGPTVRGLPGLPHFAPKAKRVIYLFQSGGPSHLELLDYKPRLKEFHGKELPDSVRQGQRLTGMTSGQKSFPVIAPKIPFRQYGKSGVWLSELLPHTGKNHRRTLPDPVDEYRGDQSRSGHHLHPDRVPATGPALIGSLARLWPWK